MEHLNVAIADDNERILDMLEEVINMDKDLKVVEKQKMGKRCVRLSKIKNQMLFFLI